MSDMFTHYRTFVRVVETGSFTSVAREYNTSQPTISRHIAVLEDHLGCLLFQRTTRALALTDDGRVFYEYARRTLEAAAEAESAVGRRKGIPTGMLKLACSGVFGRLHVIPRLTRFRKLFPHVQITLMMEDRYSDLVEEGIHLAIRIGEVDNSSLVVRKIGSSQFSVVATPEYLAGRQIPLHPVDLLDHDCIVYHRNTTGPKWSFIGPDGPFSVTAGGPIYVNTTEAVREAVLQGLGVGQVPTWHFVEGEIENGQLRVLLRGFETSPLPISAVYPSGRYLPHKVRAAIDFFASEFDADPMLQARRHD
jgi:DNA-binding transcriptional LysR family regulator